MENVVRAWSPPPQQRLSSNKKKKKPTSARDRSRKGGLSASVVWRSNAHLGAYRDKHLLDYHDAKMKSRLHNVKSTISTSLDPAISRTRRRGVKKRKKRLVVQTLGGGATGSSRGRSRQHGSSSSRRGSSSRRPVSGSSSARRGPDSEGAIDGSAKLSLEEAIAVLRSHAVSVVPDSTVSLDDGDEDGEEEDSFESDGGEAGNTSSRYRHSSRSVGGTVDGESESDETDGTEGVVASQPASVNPSLDDQITEVLAQHSSKDLAQQRETKQAEKKRRQSARAQQRSVARLSTVTTRRPPASGGNLGSLLSPAARRAASLSAKRVHSPRAVGAGTRVSVSSRAKSAGTTRQPQPNKNAAERPRAPATIMRPAAVGGKKSEVASAARNTSKIAAQSNGVAKDPTKLYSRRAPKLSTFGETKRSRASGGNFSSSNSKSRASKLTAKTKPAPATTKSSTSGTSRRLGQRLAKPKKLSKDERVHLLRGLCRRLQADETILDPYNHSGLHRGIYAEDEDHFGFIDNVVLRPLIERFTTVSAQEWAQLKALFDKDGEGYMTYMNLLRFFSKPVPESESESDEDDDDDDDDEDEEKDVANNAQSGPASPKGKCDPNSADATPGQNRAAEESKSASSRSTTTAQPKSTSSSSTSKPPFGSAALASPRRLSAAVAAAAAASSQKQGGNSPAANLNSSRRSLNASVRSTNSYNYDDDDDFDSDAYGDDFESTDEDDAAGGGDDVLSRSRKMSLHKAAANKERSTKDVRKLEEKLGAVSPKKAEQLRLAILNAAQTRKNVRVIEPLNLRLILSAHIPGLDKEHWEILEEVFSSGAGTIECEALCAHIGTPSN
eukprot:INCI11288.1.p1 GENE.INCI11288.1~~INCI11288.1.p1  ORF type:complete len:871 (-),score=181.50 INCI11288.1:196-2712(-)